MSGNSIRSVLVDLWGDLKQPDALWQVAAVLACVALAWGFSRLVRVTTSQQQSTAMRMGAGGFNRVLFPLVAMLLLVARALLSNWPSVNPLAVAIPLFASLAGIRFVIYLLRLVFLTGGGLSVWERAIAAVIWVAVGLHLTGLLPEIEALLEGAKLSLGNQKFSLMSLLAEIAARHPRVLVEPPPKALVLALGDNGIELELGFWIEDPEKGRMNVASDISVDILAEFRARGIEIPYPQREIRLLSTPPAG